jgi:hypothetical protein
MEASVASARPDAGLLMQDGKHLQIDKAMFSERFHHLPFTIRHKLSAHPLFTLTRLIELAKCLPPDYVEYNSGKVGVNLDPKLTPQNGLSVVETIRRIEECGSWMVMKFVETDAAYSELLSECLEEVLRLCGPSITGITRREGFIFISSPNSVTPYHFDDEHNFLLQIRGKKQVSIFDPKDRSLLSDVEIENHFRPGAHRNLVFKEEYQSKAQVFELSPGDGLHFPVTAPHWVKNGGEVSISFSITFRSLFSERRQRVYRCNAHLRDWGLSPTPPNESELRDKLKASTFTLANRVRQVLSKQPKQTSERY